MTQVSKPMSAITTATASWWAYCERDETVHAIYPQSICPGPHTRVETAYFEVPPKKVKFTFSTRLFGEFGADLVSMFSCSEHGTIVNIPREDLDTVIATHLQTFHDVSGRSREVQVTTEWSPIYITFERLGDGIGIMYRCSCGHESPPLAYFKETAREHAKTIHPESEAGYGEVPPPPTRLVYKNLERGGWGIIDLNNSERLIAVGNTPERALEKADVYMHRIGEAYTIEDQPKPVRAGFRHLKNGTWVLTCSVHDQLHRNAENGWKTPQRAKEGSPHFHQEHTHGSDVVIWDAIPTHTHTLEATIEVVKALRVDIVVRCTSCEDYSYRFSAPGVG